MEIILFNLLDNKNDSFLLNMVNQLPMMMFHLIQYVRELNLPKGEY